MKIITEYENDLRYSPSPMLCDKVISEKIKSPLPNMTHFMGVIGKPGSGKTSITMTLLTHQDMYHKSYHNVFVVMPKTSRDSLSGSPFKDHPPEKLFEELTPTVLNFVHEYSKVASAENHWSLLILDDVANDLKNKENERLLKALIYNRRHLKLTIWILSQSFNCLPLSIRKALSHCIFFKPSNKKESEAVFSELLFLPKEQHEIITSHVFPEGQAHNFIFMDCVNGHIHKNFNRIELSE
jgi:hypothetical protein